MFCCDVWFEVVWSGLIGCVFVFVCVGLTWLRGLSAIQYATLYGLVVVVLLLCCRV